MQNIDPTNEEFNMFFLKLGGQVSGRLKAVMIKVCTDIAEIDME